MQMQRRRRWLLVALVLLPSAIGITALSILKLRGQAEPVSTAAPTQEVLESDGAPALETTIELPTPASAPPPPSNHGPEVNEDAEDRPLFKDVMLADNVPPMAFELDTWRAEPAYRSSAPAPRHSFGRWMFGGGHFAGGGGGGSGGSGPGGDTQDPVENMPSNGGSQGGSQSQPTLPNDERHDEGGSPQDPDVPPLDDPTPDDAGAGPGDTGPMNPGPSKSEPGDQGNDETGDIPPHTPTNPVTLPEDWIKPIDQGGGSTPPVQVPEPSTWGLLGIGLLGLWFGRRSRRSPMRS
jgi:hypothetical protein